MTGLVLHGGNKGNCLHAPPPCSLPLCLWNAPVEINNFTLPRRICLGALALSKTKHTGLQWTHSLYESKFKFCTQHFNTHFKTEFFPPDSRYHLSTFCTSHFSVLNHNEKTLHDYKTNSIIDTFLSLIFMQIYFLYQQI